jgi:hypothetical protein
MVFSLGSTRVTKQFLLNNITEEECMSFYLGIIPDRDLHTNPLRNDKHPTASFYRASNGELIFKDWKTGFYANFVDVVMEKFNVPFTKALNIIAHDFGLVKRPSYESHEAAIVYDGAKVDIKSETIIQAETQDFTDTQLTWWAGFGISRETLKLYHVYSVKNVFLNGNFMYSATEGCPIYGYYFGKEDGRELWKMYFPIRKQYRFLLNNNKLQGVKQLPQSGEILVITKSLKDVMVLHELGIPAVAPQAESVIINSRQFNALKKRFKTIIFNGDWDGAGQRFMGESRRRYPSICLSFINKKKFGKDISDFVKKHGIIKAKALIEKLRSNLAEGKYDYHLNYCRSQDKVVS